MENKDETNVFDEFSNEEFEQQTSEEDSLETNNEVEMTPNDFSSFVYLKNPDVGESIELEISRIVKKPGRELKNKTTGATFYTGLKDKNEKREETIIETVNNERFSISSWGLYFQLFGNDTTLQHEARKRGGYSGIKIKITHNYNGKDAQTSAQDLMKLRDIDSVDKAEAYKQEVSNAMKEGKIYTVELLN